MSISEYPLLRDWLRATGGRVEIRSGKVDIGQRISTALTRVAAVELTLPLDAITVATVRTGSVPDEGITSGSNSLEQSGLALRLASATARDAALRLAGARLGVAVDDLSLAEGMVTHRGTNRALAIVDLLADLDPYLPVDPEARPLPPEARVEPPSAPPRGLAEMVTGAFRFIHDIERPGMLHARVIRPPQVHATLARLDADAVAAVEAQGLRVVRDGSFLAVAGPVEWPVLRAVSRLARGCEWDAGGGLPEGDIFEMLGCAPTARLAVIEGKPDTAASVPSPLEAPTLEAEFQRPYQMHGALAPSAALAEWRGGRLDILSHSQGIYGLRESIAESLDLALEAIEIEHVPGSGCYGHNGADDAAFDAALVARLIPETPILLKWTREDEHGWEPYAPAMTVKLAARLRDGRIAEWSAEAFSDTHRGRPRKGPNRAGPARLLANRFRDPAIGPYAAEPNMGTHAGMHRNLDPIYEFGKTRLVKNLIAGLPMRPSAMRCLGGAANVFAIESFMDELAAEVGADPLEFRLAHLQGARDRAVVAALRDALGPVPDGDARGVAYAQYKNLMTRAGIAVDLRVTERAEVVLERVLIVADAGRIVDPDGLRAQLEGGAIQAASWALYEEVTWDRDGVTSRDWDSYPVIRFDNIPRMETVLLDQPEAPSLGAGEATPGPMIGAIANAIHAAIGLRPRRMPFTPGALMALAMEV